MSRCIGMREEIEKRKKEWLKKHLGGDEMRLAHFCGPEGLRDHNKRIKELCENTAMREESIADRSANFAESVKEAIQAIRDTGKGYHAAYSLINKRRVQLDTLEKVATGVKENGWHYEALAKTEAANHKMHTESINNERSALDALDEALKQLQKEQLTKSDNDGFLIV